jgi:hypothetical protein
VVVAFAGIGFCAGWAFLPVTIGWLFYTTKPIAFLSDATLWVFAVLFGVSLAMIPLSAPPGEDATRSPKAQALLVLGFIWSASGGGALLLVRAVTAHVHRVTLSIPEGLLPAGLFCIPVLAGVAVAAAGKLARRRRQRGEEFEKEQTELMEGR